MSDPRRSAMKRTPEDDARYWQAVEKMRARIAEKISGERVIIYDAFKCDASGMPIDNLDSIAYSGTMRLIDDIHDYFDGPVLTNPTWLEIAVHANSIMIATGDRHHVFLDGIYEVGIEKTTPMNVSINASS